MLFAFFTPGYQEIVIVVVVCILLFGSTQVPKLARSLGSSLVEFKKGLRYGVDVKKDVEDTFKSEVDEIKRTVKDDT